MRRLLIVTIVAGSLVHLSTPAHAGNCAASLCGFVGSDSGAGLHDPDSFSLTTTGTLFEYTSDGTMQPLAYTLAAELTYENRGAALVAQGLVTIFVDPGAPRYTFGVQAVGRAGPAGGIAWTFAGTLREGNIAGAWVPTGPSNYAGAMSFAGTKSGA
jgi:hypothetical protein